MLGGWAGGWPERSLSALLLQTSRLNLSPGLLLAEPAQKKGGLLPPLGPSDTHTHTHTPFQSLQCFLVLLVEWILAIQVDIFAPVTRSCSTDTSNSTPASGGGNHARSPRGGDGEGQGGRREREMKCSAGWNVAQTAWLSYTPAQVSISLSAGSTADWEPMFPHRERTKRTGCHLELIAAEVQSSKVTP